MHNGLRILPGSYYGRGGRRLLLKNQGCHEPQEEFAFMQVLSSLKPGAVMIECGAYWGFYSMWFCKEVSGGTAHLIESELSNLEFGRRNFQVNGFNGNFYRASVGSKSCSLADGSRQITLDDFVQKYRFGCVDVLHADIQGCELEMLRGARRLIGDSAISFLFISTHSGELHQACELFLQNSGYDPCISISPSQSFSVDGLIVARSGKFREIAIGQPSKCGQFDQPF